MSQRTKAGIGAIILAISGGLNIAQQNKINELEETVATLKDAQAVQPLDENNEKIESIFPSERNDNEENSLITVKAGTEDEILEQLIDLFDYVGDPHKMPNGDVYRIVGKYKDNKILFGIFNVTKLKGTQCKYENIALDSNNSNDCIGVVELGITNINPETFESNNGCLYFIVDNKYGDTYRSGYLNIDTLQEDIPTNTYESVGEEFQASNGIWYRKVDNKKYDEYCNGLFNMKTLQEDIPTNTYGYVGEEFQAANGTWYREVDNKRYDDYVDGLFNMETLQEDIPTNTYTNIKNVGNGIYHCTDKNGEVTVIKLPRKSR